MKRIYLVPHTHYDVVWSLNKEDYLQINERIFKRAVDMVRDEDFRFLVEQTYLLEQFEQRYPRLFAEIRQAIVDGKIEIADGQYLMPDTMIPHGEVLVREMLFGKRWAKEKFGVDVPVGWCADGFGLNAQLPQIYSKAGYKWLAFRRGIPRSIGSKVSEFTWEGLDGTQIPVHWMPLGYRAGLFLDQWPESVARLSELATTDHVLMPCGSGSTPPQPETQAAIERWNREHPEEQIELATPRRFFEAFDEAKNGLSVYKGELYRPDMENVFQDVVTARVGLKMALRRAENQLLLTEKASTLAWLAGLPYPHIELRDAWKQMLFMAFHDVVSGCGIDEVYDEVWEDLAGMDERLPPLTSKAVRHLVLDDTVGPGVVVFNPTGRPVTDWVEFEVQLGDEWGEPPGVALGGEERPSEVLELTRWDDGTLRRARVGFVASVPAMGTRVYGLVERSASGPSPALVEGDEVTTPFHRVRVDPQAGTIEVRDLDGEVLVSGNEIILDEEHGDLYFQRNPLDRPIGREDTKDRDFGFATFLPEGLEIERGPLRTVITYRTGYHCMRWPYRMLDKVKAIIHRQRTLDVEKRIVLYNDKPRIDVRTRIDTRHPHMRIRVRFDTGMVHPDWTRETQFGAIEVPQAEALDGGAKVPSQSWLVGQENGRGVALFTRGAPICEVEGSEANIVLLRSVSVLCADGKSGPFIPTPDALELGEHEYEYAILPYEGSWQDARIPQEALAYTQRLEAEPVDTEPRAKATEGFAVGPDNLVVTALTRSWDGAAAILRFYESTGEATRAEVSLPQDFERVALVNLIEETERELEIEGGKVTLDVGPFEIVTLRFEP